MPDITFRGQQYTVPMMTLGQITRVSWLESQIAELAAKQDSAEGLEDFDKCAKQTDELYTQKLATIFGANGPSVLRSDLQQEEQEALESFFLLLADKWLTKWQSIKKTSQGSTPSPTTPDSPKDMTSST